MHDFGSTVEIYDSFAVTGFGSSDNIAATYITLVIPSMMHYSMQRERYKRALLPAAAPESAQSASTAIIGGTIGLTFDIQYFTVLIRCQGERTWQC